MGTAYTQKPWSYPNLVQKVLARSLVYLAVVIPVTSTFHPIHILVVPGLRIDIGPTIGDEYDILPRLDMF